MQGNPVKIGGSPTPRTTKNEDGETAKSTSSAYREKVNPPLGDVLARTIACQPPNEARIRGLVA